MATTAQAVEREALSLLWADRAALPVRRLARAVRAPLGEVNDRLAELEERGLLLRGNADDIVGVGGLSVVPTRHELEIDGVRRWTWCAWDALGLVLLAGRGGVVRSTCPESGSAVEVRFDPGVVSLQPATGVLVYAKPPEGVKIVTDWCPLLNLFAGEEAARAWIERTDTTAEVQPVARAAAEAAEVFRPYLRLRRPWWSRLLRGSR